MAKIVHFEIPVDDPDRAVSFYREAFGWETQQWEGQDYWLVQAGAEDEMGINGAFIRRQEGVGVTDIVGVPSVDETLQRIQQAGGEIIRPKMPIPGVGYAGYFRDTEGNLLGVFEPDESAS